MRKFIIIYLNVLFSQTHATCLFFEVFQQQCTMNLTFVRSVEISKQTLMAKSKSQWVINKIISFVRMSVNSSSVTRVFFGVLEITVVKLCCVQYMHASFRLARCDGCKTLEDRFIFYSAEVPMTDKKSVNRKFFPRKKTDADLEMCFALNLTQN